MSLKLKPFLTAALLVAAGVGPARASKRPPKGVWPLFPIVLFVLIFCFVVHGAPHVDTPAPEIQHSWIKCIISYDKMTQHYVLIAPSPAEYQEDIDSNEVRITNLRMGVYQTACLDVSSEKTKVKLNMHGVYYVGHAFFQSKPIHPWRSERYTIELEHDDVIYFNGMRFSAHEIEDLISGGLRGQTP